MKGFVCLKACLLFFLTLCCSSNSYPPSLLLRPSCVLRSSWLLLGSPGLCCLRAGSWGAHAVSELGACQPPKTCCGLGTGEQASLQSLRSAVLSPLEGSGSHVWSCVSGVPAPVRSHERRLILCSVKATPTKLVLLWDFPSQAFFFFFFKQYTCKRSAYKLAFQVLGKAMGWPRSQECLTLCWVGFSQGDELWMQRVLLTCRAGTSSPASSSFPWLGAESAWP